MKLWVPLMSLAIGWVASGVAAAEPGAAADARSQLAPCADRVDFLCGDLEVYENRAAATGRKIRLKVILAKARSATPARNAIVYLAGGPGASSTDAAPNVSQFLDPLRATHDLLFVDQRGTGGSHRLDCPYNGSDTDLQGYFAPFMSVEQAKTCRAQLETKADLRFYTTSVAMDDLEELRQRFGYQQFDLFGGSYGTRAAQVFLDRHPQSVRSMILMGVAGYDQLLPLHHAQGFRRGLDLIVTACLADASCSAAFPDLREELVTVARRLAQAPATVEVAHPRTGEKVKISMTQGVFAESLRFYIYDALAGSAAPMLIHQAYLGNFSNFATEVLETEPGFRAAFAFGQHLSVICSEDIPFYPPAIHFLTDHTLLGDVRVRPALDLCAVWPRGEVPADFHEPVRSEVPVLLVSGQLDPVTPPYWADAVADFLPNSQSVLLEHGHHGPGGLSNIGCFVGLVNSFLQQPGKVDDSCVASMKRPPFATDYAAFQEAKRQALAAAEAESKP